MNELSLTIAGNVTATPELRFTPAGQPVCTFRVAHTPRVRKGEQWTDGEPTFMACQAWGLMAEHVAESVERGTRVVVIGTLRTERWKGQDGEDREALRLRVDEMGPSIKYASAKVVKTSRQAQAPGPDGDAWASAQGTVAQQLGGQEVRSGDAPF